MNPVYDVVQWLLSNLKSRQSVRLIREPMRRIRVVTCNL